MHHDDCNSWEYKFHPSHHLVKESCQTFLNQLRLNPSYGLPATRDTRGFHQSIFIHVAPVACSFLAGNYRGSNFECLKHYKVFIGGVEGTIPAGVAMRMDVFHETVIEGLDHLQESQRGHSHPFTNSLFIAMLARFTAAMMVRFLNIHPYANGNGHMSRLLVWSILGSFNMLPKKWWLEDRPPGFDPLISQHLNGKPAALEKFLLKCIIG